MNIYFSDPFLIHEMTPSVLVPAIVTPDVRYLKSADGTVVYAEAVGDPSDPQIIFLHGFSLSTIVFDSIFYDPRYAKQFYLVRYDMRGHGRSGKPQASGAYASEKFAQDFSAVAQAYGLRRPVFVGWSLGATVIADIAAYLPPQSISGAVYLSALPYTSMVTRVVPKPVLETIRRFHRKDDAASFVSAKMPFINGCFAQADQVPAELRCLWAGGTLASTPHDLESAFNRPQDPTALLEIAQKGLLPLLVLHGDSDAIIEAKSLVREVEAMAWKGASIVLLEGVGHAPFYESTESVMTHIGELAKRVQAGRHAAKL
ncbi:unnamed protein product [Peniophora sp. CBMAI 1063]|nr:unnamed protein product [Peniophora sp. CBMAI 1063]